MIFWLVRCVRQLTCAAIALVGLLAMAEVGVRISRIMQAADSASSTSTATSGAGTSTFDSSQPAWKVPSSVTGWELPRLTKFRGSGLHGDIQWRTNSWGQRGPEPQVPRPADTLRVICLGDEALLGSDLPAELLFSHQLQTRLQAASRSPIEVVPGVVPSGHPVAFRLAFERNLSPLQPNVVLLHLSSTALAAAQQQRRWQVRDGSGVVVACQHPETRMKSSSNLLAQCRQEFALIDWGIREFSRSAVIGPADSPSKPSTELDPSSADVATLLEPLLQLDELCRAQGARLVVWLSPVELTETTAAEHQAFSRVALPWMYEQRIPGLDALSWLQPEMLSPDGGWTAEGHRQQADFVVGQLLANLPGPWTPTSAPPAHLPISHETPTPHRP